MSQGDPEASPGGGRLLSMQRNVTNVMKREYMLINDQTRSSASVRSASAQHTDAHHAITQTLYSSHSSFVFFATRNPVAHAQTRTRRVTYTLLSQRLTRSLEMGRLTPSRLPAGLTAAVAFCSSSPPPLVNLPN